MQVYPSTVKTANVHPLSTQKSPKEVIEDTHLPQLSSGQNARRAHSRTYSPPIIDDLDKYQFAILGSSSRSLGVPVTLGLIRKNQRSVKEKKINKKGVDANL